LACFNKLTNKWLRIAAGSRQLIGLLPAKLLIFSKQWVFWHLILRQAEIELWSMPYRLTALPAELLRIPSVRNTTGWDWPQCTILRSEVECASTQIGTCFFDCQIWFNVYILKIAPVYSNYMLFCSSTKRKGGYKGPGRPMRKARGWFPFLHSELLQTGIVWRVWNVWRTLITWEHAEFHCLHTHILWLIRPLNTWLNHV